MDFQTRPGKGGFLLLTLAICDDERYMLNALKEKITTHLDRLKTDVEIFCFSSGISLLSAGQCFDIIMMDIKMTGMDGMESIRRLRAKGGRSQVIFVTSSKDYVFQAFDVDAVHYLMKPVSDNALFHALDKAVKRCAQTDRRAITITKGSTVQVIPFRDILYCEAIDHKIYIHTLNEKVHYYSKLDALQTLLDERFFRCHRSYLVNLNFVSGKEGDIVIMTNGDKILVSRRKQQQFSQQLLSFIRNEVL